MKYNQTEQTFDDDQLKRDQIIKTWTNLLLNDGSHFVLAIDGKWGVGKTFCANLWKNYLEEQGFNVCYIDAFEYDFTDDPFMTITSNIIETFEFTELEDVANKLNIFIRTFKNQLLDNIPLLVGGGMQIVMNHSNVGLFSGLCSCIIKIFKGIAKILLKPFKNIFNTTLNPIDKVADKDKTYSQVLLEFKTILKRKTAELVEQTRQATVGEIVENNSNTIKRDAKPLIVMVDELDRCKPSYAVEMLEKLKHLFDIPNIIFILFINEKELGNAIRGVYGSKYDGKYYLHKFYDLKLELDNNNYFLHDFIIYNIRKCIHLNRYSDGVIFCLVDTIYILQKIFHLSLRDIEKLITIIKYIKYDSLLEYEFLCILFCIKIKKINIYKGIIRRDDIKLDILDTNNISVKYESSKSYIQNFQKFYARVIDEKNNKSIEDIYFEKILHTYTSYNKCLETLIQHLSILQV